MDGGAVARLRMLGMMTTTIAILVLAGYAILMAL
jgi:hypothetical protein